MNIEKIVEDFNTIADAKGWRVLHTPKNLATAIAVEVGELLPWFQWLPDSAEQQNYVLQESREQIAAELADIMAYSLVLADKLGIDMKQALADKMTANKQRFLDSETSSGDR